MQKIVFFVTFRCNIRLNRLKGGGNMNEQVFHRLYDDYHYDLFRFLMYMIKDRQAAEDLSHEVYIRAIKAYESFQNKSSEKTWLLAIAKNVAIDYFRKQKVRRKHAFDFYDWETEQLISNEQSPEDLTIFNEKTAQIIKALDLCTGDQKMVIVLRYIQQMSILETATILHWSEAKVKTTQHRAVQKLKSLLQEREKEGFIG